jgi:WD40 repeat protein
MARPCECLALVIGVVMGLCPAFGQGKEAPGRQQGETTPRQPADYNGDPLPEGAIARLGLGRLHHPGGVNCLAFSPDGKILATGGNDRLIRLWDAGTGKELRRLTGHQAPVTRVAFSPDGKTLASGSYDKTVRFWDVLTGRQSSKLTTPAGIVTALAFSPDGKALATGSDKSSSFGVDGKPVSGSDDECRSIYLWETVTGKELRHWAAHRGGTFSLAFSSDGKALASGGSSGRADRKDVPTDDYGIAIWDPATGKKLTQCAGHADVARTVIFSPDGKSLASAGLDKGQGPSISLWDASTGKRSRSLGEGPIGFDPISVSFAPDGKSLAAGGRSSVRNWGVADGKLLWSIPDTGLSVVAFSPDGKTLAIAVESGRIRLWDVASRKDRLAPPGKDENITSLAIAPDSKTVVTGSYEGTARVWELATGKPVREFRDEGGPWGGNVIFDVALSPDGKTLALSHVGEAGITLWDVAGGRRAGRISGPEYRVLSLAFSPDGKTMLAGGLDDTAIHLWDMGTRKELRALKKDKDGGWCVAFSPDGRTVAASGRGLWVWDAASGKVLYQKRSYGGATAFSPEGFLLAVPRDRLELLEVSTGKEVGHVETDAVSWGNHGGVAFSPDGRYLAVTFQKEVRLLDVATGRKVRTFDGEGGDLAFSPDGKALVTRAAGGTALVWDLSDLVEAKGKTAPSAEHLRALWDDLKGGDRLKAYDALRRLRAAPESALALFGEQLRPVAAVEAKRVAGLIADLDSEQFETRERAARELTELGGAAEPALRQALKGQPSAEVRARVEGLLERLPSSQEVERIRWALRLLEHFGTTDARRLLEKLARGDPESWQTKEAKASLERLDSRNAPSR